ncbi:hypothetical protein NDU88_005692 [Pleurodeles waltl]|uniref:Uncharacterized protein n=1 Tax=Pleurodeles waltl TaxID=8319 RepID=A0AAV7WC82_PLEWA|nr:hypothetical protein NDU88_005692 [Pleurodeles waltl]
MATATDALHQAYQLSCFLGQFGPAAKRVTSMQGSRWRAGVPTCPGGHQLNPSQAEGGSRCAAGPDRSRVYGGIGGAETAVCIDGGTSYL